ncbi:Cache domain [Desulfatibacillum alkenivorans DSM 16219]|uniref:Cache domain n=1 Tax=Desulfatibacillum alkenivorans DSM 16219 TaxID=1121393 RepID=A0A1M6PWY6_9BACT|nr:cache domain-containing protein [Desulfatibacillum alkenivorans]SHK12408.1 Cache domain [Desulfatibacillum alkenivorans DSM 16219]
MKAMHRLGWLVVCLAVVLTIGVPAFAQEQAVKEECVAKVKQAVEMAQKVGMEKAIQTLNNPDSPYIWKDSYVFCLDLEKRLVSAHPVNPALVGKDWAMSAKDANGKMFFAEFIRVAMDPGEGWVEYVWPKPGETTPEKKATYVLKVPGQHYCMGAGAYTE